MKIFGPAKGSEAIEEAQREICSRWLLRRVVIFVCVCVCLWDGGCYYLCVDIAVGLCVLLKGHS